MIVATPERQRTPEERYAISRQARYDLAKVDFAYFWRRFVKIRSDDPLDPKPIRTQDWEYQVDLARRWQSGESEVALKARQLGISWEAAAYKYWRAAYHGWAVGFYSRGEAEARHQIDNRVRFIELHLPAALRKASKKSDTLLTYPDGGSILAFPSTPDAGVGYTFQLVMADEAAFHEYGGINYAAYLPTLSAGAQFIAFSTADPSLGPSGFFYALWRDAVSGENGYAPIFLPWWSRPDRQLGDVVKREIVPNLDWLERERRRYKSAPPGSMEAFYPATPGAAFVARSGLVYGRDHDGQLIFDPAPHPRGNLAPDPCRWKDCKWHYGYVDWGGGDPTALGLIGVTSSGRIHQFRELHRTGPVTVEEIAEWFQRHAPTPGGYDMGYDSIECGADEPVAIASLRALGLPAKAADTRREEGLGAMAALLKQRRMTFNLERCPHAVAEFDSYRWKEVRDPFSKERYATSTPHDHHGDHKDGCRYVCMEIQSDELSRFGDEGPAAVVEIRW